jgi:5-formyltetrahydrofolate cyclo-ligase
LALEGGLDLVLVPGLAFSLSGKRLGRGKGYYDTFLQTCSSVQDRPPYTIALSFSEQIIESVPTDNHDYVINAVITP